MRLLVFLSRWLKRASSSSSSAAAAAPERPQALVIPDEHASSSLDASPLQAGLSRFSSSRRQPETETASPPLRGARQQQPLVARSPAPRRAAASTSLSPQGRKPFAELSNKVKERERDKQLAVCFFRGKKEKNSPSPLLSLSLKNSPLPRPRVPSPSSQRQRRR